jgi:hypothetical protein
MSLTRFGALSSPLRGREGIYLSPLEEGSGEEEKIK